MATIRDVVEALARRGGVDAVVVVGDAGLPIDARAANGVDADNVAALLPSVINGLAQLGEAGGRGPFGTGVLEFGSGLAVVSVLNADALLVVLVRPATNVGALLYDLRRQDRKSTRLNSSHSQISYAVFCLKKKKKKTDTMPYGKIELKSSI